MARLRFETDLSTSLQAGADLAKAYKKVGEEVKESVREMNALEKAAKRLVDQNLSPQEKYNQKLDTMAKAVKAGKLSMEEAERTAGRLRTRLDETASSGKKAFGEDAVLSIANYAKGFLGLTAIVGTVTSALREMDETARASADRSMASLGAFGQLQQVATSPADFAKMAGQARSMIGPIFSKDQGAQAADFVFALRNAGYTDSEIGYITRLGSSGQVKPENMQAVAEGLKKAQSVFGKAEAGSIEQVTNKVFQAANVMQTEFAQAAVATTLFGKETTDLGFSDEEALAAFVAIEGMSPGTEEAATRMRSLMTQLQKDKLGKGTLKETIDSLRQRMAKGEKAIDITGEIRAAAGLSILASTEGQQVFNTQLGEISRGNTEDIVGTRRFLDADPRIRSAKRRQEAEGKLAETQAAATDELQNLFNAMRAEEVSTALGRNRDRLGAWFVNRMYGLTDVMGNERGALENYISGTRGSPELRTDIEDYLKRTAEGIERIKNDVQAPKPSGRQEP